MLQKPSQQNHQQELASSLQTLSAREQIELLFHATRSLARRDQAELLSAAGLSFLKERIPSILLHVVLKRVITGALWGILCLIGALLLILLLALIEGINAHATTPVIIGVISFLVGFLLFSLVNFFEDIAQFIKTTRSRSERQTLLQRLSEREYAEKMALLRNVSLTLARKVPGESLLLSLLLDGLFLVMEALLLVLLVLLCGLFPVLDSFPWYFLEAGLAFCAGFFLIRAFHNRLRFRGLRSV